MCDIILKASIDSYSSVLCQVLYSVNPSIEVDGLSGFSQKNQPIRFSIPPKINNDLLLKDQMQLKHVIAKVDK